MQTCILPSFVSLQALSFAHTFRSCSNVSRNVSFSPTVEDSNPLDMMILSNFDILKLFWFATLVMVFASASETLTTQLKFFELSFLGLPPLLGWPPAGFDARFFIFKDVLNFGIFGLFILLGV